VELQLVWERAGLLDQGAPEAVHRGQMFTGAVHEGTLRFLLLLPLPRLVSAGVADRVAPGSGKRILILVVQ
jgi:hypothetical protein